MRGSFALWSSTAALMTLMAAPTVTAQVRTRFAGMDQNRDGAISRSEWRGNETAFRRHDWNNDGVLSGEEVRDHGNQAAHNFALVDLDRNGHVTIQEWRRAFTDLDANRDGSLTEDELWGVVDAAPNTPASRAFTAGRERGVIDGREAGRQDARRRVWDLDGQRELERADAGYRNELGALDQYQNGYREGFRQGYTEGFGPRR
jgi:Ca2+-binding EF-hand superfamily protein